MCWDVNVMLKSSRAYKCLLVIDEAMVAKCMAFLFTTAEES